MICVKFILQHDGIKCTDSEPSSETRRTRLPGKEAVCDSLQRQRVVRLNPQRVKQWWKVTFTSTVLYSFYRHFFLFSIKNFFFTSFYVMFKVILVVYLLSYLSTFATTVK